MGCDIPRFHHSKANSISNLNSWRSMHGFYWSFETVCNCRGSFALQAMHALLTHPSQLAASSLRQLSGTVWGMRQKASCCTRHSCRTTCQLVAARPPQYCISNRATGGANDAYIWHETLVYIAIDTVPRAGYISFNLFGSQTPTASILKKCSRFDRKLMARPSLQLRLGSYFLISITVVHTRIKMLLRTAAPGLRLLVGLIRICGLPCNFCNITYSNIDLIHSFIQI